MASRKKQKRKRKKSAAAGLGEEVKAFTAAGDGLPEDTRRIFLAKQWKTVFQTISAEIPADEENENG